MATHSTTMMNFRFQDHAVSDAAVEIVRTTHPSIQTWRLMFPSCSRRVAAAWSWTVRLLPMIASPRKSCLSRSCPFLAFHSGISLSRFCLWPACHIELCLPGHPLHCLSIGVPFSSCSFACKLCYLPFRAVPIAAAFPYCICPYLALWRLSLHASYAGSNIDDIVIHALWQFAASY